MNEQIKEKISKVLALVNKGVDGEKDAAERALKRLLKKYNIVDKDLENINLKEYTFKYSKVIDIWLLQQILEYFLTDKKIPVYKDTYGVKELRIKLEYLDWITIETAYGYFKPHMNREWSKFSENKLNRYRKQSNKNKRREELYKIFFSAYILKSKIYRESQIVKRKSTPSELRELRDIDKIEGGNFKRQVTRGLYLEE
ncbi:DUF2786 domain-containing protein [Riemerella columbipharyngis]|uniref:DUF2786 domain-containing protein n=1 Tax=Riemerella columbipharyngis TaxID=1071918 RepID=A0A1G7FI30_9FLAO|nr:DUF2786 domain-containing protein [Riemerella columbipharyngis]SDE75477.1 hypothetical protein SAMN05421544_1237 [Riemerella columbipharyngis]